MITGAHDAEADRAFLRDVLQFRSIDAGGGWLIFALPPAELGVHPGDSRQRHAEHELLGAVLYLMCDDLGATMTLLAANGVRSTEVETAEWGRKTTICLPSGGELGLYQPAHVTALEGPTKG